MKEVENKEFKAEDLSSISFTEWKLTGCLFENCTLFEANLKNSLFASCTFRNCQIHIPKLEGIRLQHTHFKRCKLTGIDFSTCEKRLFSPSFDECQLLFCNFSDLNLKNCTFNKCLLKECHFSNANLTSVTFNECRLTGTVFHRSNLKNSDLTTAVEYHIDPRTNNMEGALVSLPEAIGLLHPLGIKIV